MPDVKPVLDGASVIVFRLVCRNPGAEIDFRVNPTDRWAGILAA